MTNIDQTNCWKCNASMPRALVRCRECGAARNAAPARQTSSNASGMLRAPSAQTEQKALSIDDMFSTAEDVGEDDINQFVIATSEALNSPPATQSPKTQSAPLKTIKRDPGQPREIPGHHPPLTSSPPPDSPSGSSAIRTPAPIPKRSGMSGVTPAPATANPSRRRRNTESTASSGSAVAATVATAIRQSLKQAPPTLQSADPKALKAQEKAAQKLLVKASKLFQKFENDDTKPAIDSIRQTLVELGATQHTSVIPPIAKFLDDPRPSLPESAARALGTTRCHEAFEHLVTQLLKTPIDSSGYLITALGSLGDRRAVFPLIMYGSEYPQYQMRVVDTISEIGPDAVPPLIELAGGQDATQQLIVCLAMGKAKDVRCLESLSNLLAHELATIRCYSAEALGDLGDNKAIRLLVSALRDPVPNVRAAAAIALSKIPDERSVSPLIRCLKDPDQQVRLLAINALGTIGDKSAASALSQLLDEDDPELIAATCDSLGRLGDPSAIDRLIQFLVLPENDEHTAVVLKVIDTVRRLQATAAVPALLELLQSPDSNIRLKTVEAIGQCKQKAAAEEIEHILAKDPSDEVRAAAAKALGELKDPESLNALVEALQDTLNVRVKSIIALGLIRNSNAVPVLLPLLKDQSPEIRYHSSQALAELDHKKAIHQIEPLVLDEVPMVVRGAFKAIAKLGDDRNEKQILTSVKKRVKANMSVMTKGNSFQLTDMINGLGESLSFKDSNQKSIIIGSGVSFLVLCLLVGYFLMPTPKRVLLRKTIEGFAFDSKGNEVYVATAGGTLETWSSPEEKNYSRKSLVDFQGLIDVVVAADNTLFASTGTTLYRLDQSEPNPIATFKIPVVDIEVSADRSIIAATDSDKNILSLSSADGSPKGGLSLEGQGVTATSIGHDGTYFAVAYNNGILRLIDGNGKVNWEVNSRQKIASTALSPDGSLLAITNTSGDMQVYDVKTKLVSISISSPDIKAGASRLRFSPDSKRIIGNVNGISIWNLDSKTAQSIPCNASDFVLNNDATKAICKVGEGSSSTFEYIDIENLKVLNSPPYKIY